MERGDIVEYVDRPGCIKGMVGSIGVVIKSSSPRGSLVRWIVKNVELPRRAIEKELGAALHNTAFLKVIGHAD